MLHSAGAGQVHLVRGDLVSGDAAMGNKGNFFSRNTMKRYVEERIVLEKVEFVIRNIFYLHIYMLASFMIMLISCHQFDLNKK